MTEPKISAYVLAHARVFSVRAKNKNKQEEGQRIEVSK